MNQTNSYVIYSAGETGKQVADLLLEKSQPVIAIFDRNPGSRDADLISNKPSSISGTSSSNKRTRNSGAVLDKIN